MFEVMPAIDVAAGGLAAYTPEGPRPIEAFGGDPVAAAEAFAAAGARWLHVVDMDLALDGEPRNLDVLARIRDSVPHVRLQASGGLRTAEQVELMLGAGAVRVVLGSGALADESAVQAMLASEAGRLVVGIEVVEGRIRSRGRDPVDLDLAPTLEWLMAAGASRFLVTAVARVGGLAGPDTATVGRVARTGVPVLAAGGVASLTDLAALRQSGASGAVVGRAILEGTLDLREALTWADG